jgi:hypothetical protein
MVTPERQKTPGKSRRKSVSQSPWLAKTPRSGKKNVISEELLISPDACRPLMTTSRKLVNIPLTSHAMTEARMNSTIMSAFGTTPPSNHSVGSSRSSGSNSSDRGESFVGESPSPIHCYCFHRLIDHYSFHRLIDHYSFHCLIHHLIH